MADEDSAPSRAEIESMLWALKRLGTPVSEVNEAITVYLHGRGVSDRGIDLVMSDLHTYANYPVEVSSGENG